MHLTEGVGFARSAAKLTTTGNYAFKDCSSLTVIDITELRVAGHNVFENCTSLTEVTLSRFTDLGSDMFFNCSSLTKLKYTDLGTKDAGTIAYSGKVSPFGNCNVTEIECADGILTFAGGAWYNADKTVLYKASQELTAFVVPSTVVEIGANAFAGNKNITSVRFTEKEGGGYALKTIGNYAFSGCGSLASITLPSSVENSA